MFFFRSSLVFLRSGPMALKAHSLDPPSGLFSALIFLEFRNRFFQGYGNAPLMLFLACYLYGRTSPRWTSNFNYSFITKGIPLGTNSPLPVAAVTLQWHNLVHRYFFFLYILPLKHFRRRLFVPSEKISRINIFPPLFHIFSKHLRGSLSTRRSSWRGLLDSPRRWCIASTRASSS